MSNKEFFNHKRGSLPSRKHDVRNGNTSSFLIVTEGEQTEPLYFHGIIKFISTKYGSNIDVKCPKITVQGKGKSSVRLVEETLAILARSHQIYQYCWVVFDKDDNRDFDEAILLAKKNRINVAWSNQSFEYWLCLHFGYDSSSRMRNEWEKKLDTYFRKSGLSAEGYKKNSEEISTLPTLPGFLKTAIDNAEKIEKLYPSSIPASKRDPCTTVHHLIQSFSPYLTELL